MAIIIVISAPIKMVLLWDSSHYIGCQQSDSGVAGLCRMDDPTVSGNTLVAAAP